MNGSKRGYYLEPPSYCLDCGRPLRSFDSQTFRVCGMCQRQRRARTRAIAGGLQIPEPWDGWGT